MSENDNASGTESYLSLVVLIERLHRQFLDGVKGDLDRMGLDDINNVQALLLFNLGDEEMSVGELTYRGYYLGSNVTYNLKKLVESGYIEQERSQRDRRSSRVRLSEKGQELRRQLAGKFESQAERLFQERGLAAEDLEATSQSLLKLERFWRDIFRY